MNILITNDDGIRADGIIELAKELAKTHNIYVVAPDTQRSATGHAITIHNPIMVNKEYIDDNISAYSISGTPADCVKVGVEALFKEVNIDMVLSGINNGPNLGTDVIYSGTVSAAIEGFVQNKPSIAFSLNEFNVSKEVYSQVSKHASKIVNDIKDKLNILNDCILNGKRYFWIGGKVKELEQENDSDIIVIEEGYITITPVNIDMTNNKKIEILKNELL